MATPAEVKRVFVDEAGWPTTGSIPAPAVRGWAADPDLEVRGVLFEFLSRPDHVARVQPALPEEWLFSFITSYFECCITAEPELVESSHWVLAYPDLSNFISHWVQGIWRDSRETPQRRLELKAWLERILVTYPSFRSDLAVTLTDTFLLRKSVRKHFASWAAHPVLASSFPELARST